MKVIKADVNDDIIFNTIEDIDTGIVTGITSVLKLPTGNFNNILIDFNFINKKLPQELNIIANFNINEKVCIDVPIMEITVGDKTYENACYIPAEVFEEPCYFMLGLYGFALEGEDEIKQRISLIPLKNIVVKGSYNPDATEGIIPSPTAFEVYFNEVAEANQQMQTNLNNYNKKLEEKYTEMSNNIDTEYNEHLEQFTNQLEEEVEEIKMIEANGILADTVVGWNGDAIPEGYEEADDPNEIVTITNENGTATKFPDGTMICRGVKTYPELAFTQVGNMYYRSLEGVTFPVPFIENPIPTSQVVMGNIGNVTIGSGLTKEKIGSFYVTSSVAQARPVTIYWTATGNWK